MIPLEGTNRNDFIANSLIQEEGHTAHDEAPSHLKRLNPDLTPLVNRAWEEASFNLKKIQAGLDEAGRIINSQMGNSQKGYPLSNFCEELMRYDLVDAAIEVAHAIPEPWICKWTFRNICADLARKGRIEKALEIAHIILFKAKTSIYENISIALMQKFAPDTEKAKEIAGLIPDKKSKSKEQTLKYISSLDLSANNHTDQAVEVASTISDKHMKRHAFSDIIYKVLMHHSDIEKAKEIAHTRLSGDAKRCALKYIEEEDALSSIKNLYEA